MAHKFNCYEYLFLQNLDEDPSFFEIVKTSILEGHDLKDIPCDLWYAAVSLHETKGRFFNFLKKISFSEPQFSPRNSDTLFHRYLNANHFTEMHLDSMFSCGSSCKLQREIFLCTNLRVLSLKCNFLETLPPDIGRLKNLQFLALTNNRLQNFSIPYTLTFCTKLETLQLDNNLLDALPGFLLEMDSLKTVHRHGNHNYFKATFMWYHTDVNHRILVVRGQREDFVLSLKLLTIKSIVGSKKNFFANDSFPPLLQRQICDIYLDFRLCYNCSRVNFYNDPCYKVYTFKNPYLGNTCVPFQHWACSRACAEAIEFPAREEQLRSSREQDTTYYEQINTFLEYNSSRREPRNFRCNMM